MKKIEQFNVNGLKTKDLIDFGVEIESAVMGSVPQDHNAIFQDFRDALLSFKVQLADEEKTLVEDIREADMVADQAWGAINMQLNLNMSHYDKDVRQAASEAFEVFREIPNPTRLPYEEEYSQLAILLEKMVKVPRETLEKAMIQGWLEELARRVDSFNRVNDSQSKPAARLGKGKQLRLAVYDAYRNMVTRVNASQMLNADEFLDGLCDKVNEIISRYADKIDMKVPKAMLNLTFTDI